MGELISVASQTTVTTYILATVTVTIDSFLRSL